MDKGLLGGFLAKNSEAFVFAAQEQALKTMLVQTKWNGGVSPVCHVCGVESESVRHVSCGYKVLA